METTKHTNSKKPINNVIGLIILFVLTVTLFNCSKDDDGPQQLPEPTTKEKLTAGDGKWYIESISNNTTDNCEKKSYYQFLDNNSMIISSYGLDSNNKCISQSAFSGTFQVVHDNIIDISDGNGTISLGIVSLTESELILQLTENGATTTFIFDKTEG